MPSLFSMAHPFSAFQLWFVVYVYLLPILLYGVWASLSLMDLMDAKQPNLLTALSVILLRRARSLSPSARVATVVVGAVVWLIPLIVALWLVVRPLGPKALS